MKSSSALLAAGAAALVMTLSACDGLKEAMNAHVSTVARAGSHELTVDRLAALLSEAKVPPRKDVASAIANAWLDYQLLGQAVAKGDTVVTQATVDSAAWAQLASLKARKYYDMVSKNWGNGDTATAHKMYDDGELLSAQHILILTKGAPETDKPALKARAGALKAQVNSGNFAATAAKNSQDPQSARMGGKLGIFRKGTMVPIFEQTLLSLKPGQISPVIESEFGYHIIRRPTYDEVKGDLAQAATNQVKQQAESAFVAQLQQNGKLELRKDVVSAARAVILNPDGHLKDKNTLATSSAGTFTAGRLAQWIQSMPPTAQQQQRTVFQAAPDSIVANFVKNFVTNELVLKAATDAKITATPEEQSQLYQGFIASRKTSMTQLGIDPQSLAAGAKTSAEREKLAAARIETYMDKLVTGEAQFAEIAQPIARVLRDHADASVNDAGLDRALEKAIKAHAAADSGRRATQPTSAVPLDGPAPAGPALQTPQPVQ